MKRYALTYDFMGNEVVVDIDHGVCTDDLLHEINNFWSEADYRLDQADGNVLHAVLKMLCCRVLHSSVADWNLRAWCQLHHLRHDAKHHAETARTTRRERLAVADMFEGSESNG